MLIDEHAISEIDAEIDRRDAENGQGLYCFLTVVFIFVSPVIAHFIGVWWKS